MGVMLAVLLPPSEGKAAGGDGPGWDPASGRFGDLAYRRRRVAKALRVAKGGDEKMLGAGGGLLGRARSANRSLIGAPTMPAWERFTGVVWEHLAATDLDAAALERASEAVVVVSAVAGLSAWDDPLPDFRLKLSASITPLGPLASFWREPLSKALNARLDGRTVVDLLPNEHRAAWRADPARYRLVRPYLITSEGKPGGHAAKAAKGLLARALLMSTDVDRTLASFDPAPLRLEVDEIRPG